MLNLILKNSFSDFNRFFDDFEHKSLVPNVNISTKDDKTILSVELAGLTKEDVNLDLKNGYLSISGEKKVDNGDTYRREISQGQFKRSFFVGKTLSEKDVSAKMENGVLTVTLEAPAEEKPKSIAIN